MRPIRWLHISDIHLRTDTAWSHDVVLNAMQQHVETNRSAGIVADFVVVTGDIAFSGSADEYCLAVEFFDALQPASGVPKERIFCVPGNHDIDRTRETMCFDGARRQLLGPNQVDTFLGGGDNLSTLLKREEQFRDFQMSYFGNQDRARTADGLGYVHRLVIDEIRISIVGLDSAWLAQGGVDDHGKLLIGERQVINAVDLAIKTDDPPHIVLCMAHHPLHLLHDFDRRPIQSTIDDRFNFFHCGHLHEPETRLVGNSRSRCLVVAAGASFETRETLNAYSIVTLDLARSVSNVDVFRYSSLIRAFSTSSQEEYEVDVNPQKTCTISNLAMAIGEYDRSLNRWAHYYSALLLDYKSEFPIRAQDGLAFGSLVLARVRDGDDLGRLTFDFMTFRNVLRVLYGPLQLYDILCTHGSVIQRFNEGLSSICNEHPLLVGRLDQCDQEARAISGMSDSPMPSYTISLLSDLAVNHEWEELRGHAVRNLQSSEPSVRTYSRRMLALGLSHSEDSSEKAEAIEIYQELISAHSAEFIDLGNCAELLFRTGKTDEAMEMVLTGMCQYRERCDVFLSIGHRIVAETGDSKYRVALERAAGRST